MKAEYFDLTEENYAAGIYPKNIKSICTKTTPNPPNYYYIEGWFGAYGKNLTYPEAKQRIDGMNADIKRKQQENDKKNADIKRQNNKTQKTVLSPNSQFKRPVDLKGLSPEEQKTLKEALDHSNFREVSGSSAGSSPSHSPSHSPEVYDELRVG